MSSNVLLLLIEQMSEQVISACFCTSADWCRPDCLLLCRRPRVMPHAAVDRRARTYSLYTLPGTGNARDSPVATARVPRTVRFSPADRSAGGPRKLTLPLELGEPRQRLGQPEEPVGDVQLVLSLGASLREVDRPVGRAAVDRVGRRLDELGDGDVDDTLTAGLGAGDTQQAVDLTGSALPGRAGELVAEADCYSPL